MTKKMNMLKSHPEFSSGSHEMLKQVQHDVSEEHGRSMVEMLGVLAIIGVLSVAGIAGYTTAMKKHRANELLNEASKRAVVLAMKVATGQPINNDSLAEFTDPSSNHTYTAEANPNNAKQFNIAISGVSKEVCEQMQATMAGVIRGIECPTNASGTATLTFNNDMSATAYASDYKNQADCVSPFKWCSELGTNGQCIEGNDCCVGITTSDCLLCNINTGAITKPGDTQTCDFDGGTDNGKCDGNGNCVENSNLITFMISSSSMTYYDAETFCTQHSMVMAEVSDFSEYEYRLFSEGPFRLIDQNGNDVSYTPDYLWLKSDNSGDEMAPSLVLEEGGVMIGSWTKSMDEPRQALCKS